MRLLTGSIVAACLIAMAMAKPASENEQALRVVSDSLSQFSGALFKTISEEKPGNLITSPLSAGLVLSMAAYGAGGNTEEQFKRVLHLPESKALSTAGYQNLVDNLNSIQSVQLSIANKAYADVKSSLKPTYTQLTENYFRSSTETVNFAENVQAADTINTWVKQQTKNRISDIVNADDLNSLTRLVLLNAVYFKGQWKVKFDPKLTTNRPFHVDSKTVKEVPTMYKRDSLVYGELPELNAKFVEIPYKGDEVSMVVIVPNEKDGLNEVERKLGTINYSQIFSQGSKQEVELFVPRFKIDSKIELNGILEKMGLTDMFTRNANFSGISDDNLHVSKVVQKAFIEVNEEGSEATAVTGQILVNRAPAPPRLRTVLRVDRPFHFAIKTNKAVLFVGSTADPA